MLWNLHDRYLICRRVPRITSSVSGWAGPGVEGRRAVRVSPVQHSPSSPGLACPWPVRGLSIACPLSEAPSAGWDPDDWPINKLSGDEARVWAGGRLGGRQGNRRLCDFLSAVAVCSGLTLPSRPQSSTLNALWTQMLSSRRGILSFKTMP